MVCNFPTEQRAAEIAAQRCKQFGYGLVTTQSCMVHAVRYAQLNHCTAEYAARLMVPPPYAPVPGVVA